MKIGIRADGGTFIGMGHIMRTLVLAKELSKCHETFYVCRIDEPLTNKYKIGIDKVKAEGFKVKYVRENNILEDIRSVSADLLITDSYEVDENYFNETKKIFHKTAYIDDMNLYYFNVDYLINQNVDGTDLKYKVNKDTKLLIGPQYVMLRDEFRNKQQKIISRNVENIMITVGGADAFNVTETLIDYVKDLEYNFHIIIGPSFKKDDYVKRYKSKKMIFYYNANMYEIMQKCDIAISASGSTLYEFAASGVPVLSIILADNQKGIASKMENLGVTINLGWYFDIKRDSFIEKMNNLCYDFSKRKEMSKKGKTIINTDGVESIVDIITR